MEANWAWGKVQVSLTEEEAKAILLGGQQASNQLLKFLLDQIKQVIEDEDGD